MTDIIATTVTTTTEKTLQTASAAEVEAVMSDQQVRRELPRSTTELVGQASSDVVSGLGKGSAGLALVILNVIGIAAAIFFLNLLISGQQSHLANLLKLQQDQLKEIVVVHNREFDALMDMQAKSAAALATMAASLTPPPSAPVSQQPPPPPQQPSRR